MKRLAFLMTLLIPVFTFSQIINIPDDYPTIQLGIDAASNGDTVLVDTGTYVEHINFNGKSITVASLYLTTKDTSYISNTIIDGGEWDIYGYNSVVMFDSGEDSSAVLSGFTLQNGLGYTEGEAGEEFTAGGGIYCRESHPTLKNLIVKNNEAFDSGGGGYFFLSNAKLLSVTIENNTSRFGGGIYIQYGCDITFDSILPSNIYYNNAIVGNDLFSHDSINVYLNTFSVLTPTGYYAAPLKNFNFQISKGLITLVDANLYVAPNGSDDNDGLSEDTPLKSIKHATSIIKVNSSHQNTIHLLEGEYSESNENIFPLYIPDYTTLKGTDACEVTLIGGYESIIILSGNIDTKLSNLTLTDGNGMEGRYGGGINCWNADVVMDKIIFYNNNTFESGGGIYATNNSNLVLTNLSFMENYASEGGAIYCNWSNLIASNINVINNYGFSTVYIGGKSAEFKDLLVANNNTDIGILCGGTNLTLINSTITGQNGDAADWVGGITSYHKSDITLTNTILWNNYPNEISCQNNNDTLSVSYSDLQGGNDSIFIGDSTTVFWLEGNIDQDPHFVGSGNHPYQINDYSPCIDAGTPDTTGLNLPELDLAGEVRIFNDRVDMGAYEWNTYVGIEDASMPEQDKLQVDSYPNPFTTTTTIEYELAQPETVIIAFYNQFGKQVDRLEQNQQAGQQQIVWAPKNLVDGIYYFRLSTDKQVTSGKIVLAR